MDLGTDPKAFEAFGIVPRKEISRIYIDSDSDSDSSDAGTGLDSSGVFLDIDSLLLSPVLTPILEVAPESVVEDVSLPSSVLPKRGNTIGARMLALKRYDDGILMQRITEETGVSRSSVYKLRAKAISQGWREGDIVKPFHIDDAPWSGRLKISTATALFIVKTMTKNSTTRGWSCARIAAEVSNTPSWQPVSQTTVWRALTDAGYGVYKRTVKPGLTQEMKAARLAWCYKYQHWKLEDWKNVIFSNETSVQLRGVRRRRRI